VWDSWMTEGGTWSIGAPGSGPGSAYAGAKCAFAANYVNNVDARLLSPPFTVAESDA